MNSQTALVIADMASGVPARMFARAENFRQAATVLDGRALLAESFALQFAPTNTDTDQTIDGTWIPNPNHIPGG